MDLIERIGKLPSAFKNSFNLCKLSNTLIYHSNGELFYLQSYLLIHRYLRIGKVLSDTYLLQNDRPLSSSQEDRLSGLRPKGRFSLVATRMVGETA